VPAVSNSSPLIYLSALQDLDLLHDLLGAIVIPSAVYREVVVNGEGQPGASEVEQAVGDWITLVDVEDRSQVNRLQSTIGLQVGECEAIVLAGQLQIGTVVLDDQQGVREAESRTLTVVRTPSLYLAAKRAGIIQQVKPKLDSLRLFGFRLRDEHYRAILQRAGES
jgi:predicted nucleic acid-binding protein